MKRILFTGASGFLGNNIIPILQHNNYECFTLGLSDNDYYKIDLSKVIPEFNESFDIVLHAAGKAHSVPKTPDDTQSFYDVNLTGTINLCSALERVSSPKSFIFISTVAVYGLEEGYNITEAHPLNGNIPYSLSKIQAESFLQEWCSKHSVILSILRPPLIAGINPPGNLGAMIKGISSGYYLSIARGKSKKSVLMADDIAHLIPALSSLGGVYNVCDDYNPSIGEIEKLIAFQLKKKNPISVPYILAKSLAIMGDCLGEKAPINSAKLKKITKSLTFSNQKAKQILGWQPLNVLEHFKIF